MNYGHDHPHIEGYDDRTSHHRAMANLKSRLGDPRPEGDTLSLINQDSSRFIYTVYYQLPTGSAGLHPYQLSECPDDYVWEPLAENISRKWHDFDPFAKPLSSWEET